MRIDGVKEARADYRRDWVWARYDAARVTPEKLVETINQATSFNARLPNKGKDPGHGPAPGTDSEKERERTSR